MDYFLELFFGGLTRGSIYALLALGYTMVYGIVGLINFAHGEIYMIGAFTALIAATVLTLLDLPALAILALASLAAVVYSSAYGYTVEKMAYKPLRRAPRLSPLISAIGMSVFLQNYVRLAQTSDFMPFPRFVPDFPLLEPVVHIVGSSEIVILGVTTLAMVLLSLLIKFSRIGKAMRATAQDREMAMLVGVDVNRVISVTFVIGSALAAVGASSSLPTPGRSILPLAFSPALRPSPPPSSGASAAFRERFWEASFSAGPRASPPVTCPVTTKTSSPSPSWCSS
jgi:branched-chain amino acid transport system permease protein